MGPGAPAKIRGIVSLVALALALSGCQRSIHGGSGASGGAASTPPSRLGGNGIGDEGRIRRYIHLDAIHPCAETGSDGTPVPNAELLVGGEARAQLLRDACVLLPAPLKLNPAELQLSPDGGEALLYRGRKFVPSGSNELIRSDAFDQAPWVGIGASASGDSGLAPDGTRTADLLRESAATGFHYLQQSPQYAYSPGSTMSFSVYLKAAGRTHVRIQIQDATTWNDQIKADFTLQGNGIVVGTGTNGQGLGASGSIVALPDGWYLASVSGAPSPRYSNLEVDVGVQASPGVGSYAGDGASGVLVWGAQLETGPAATIYLPKP